MLSCIFNLLVLIICVVSHVLIGHSFFFMSCIVSSFSHYSLDYSSSSCNICKSSIYLGGFCPSSLICLTNISPELSFIFLTLFTVFLLCGQCIWKWKTVGQLLALLFLSQIIFLRVSKYYFIKCLNYWFDI